MENQYGYENVEILDPRYTVYALQDRTAGKSPYGLPVVYRGLFPVSHQNELVEYTLNSARQRQVAGTGSDCLEDVFSDRIGLIRSKIELALLQLDKRKDIHQRVLYEIAQDDVRADNLLIEMGPAVYYINRERLAIEKVKFDLEKQKRMEEVAYFKDTAFLNKELKESLIEYLAENQKSSFVSDMEV